VLTSAAAIVTRDLDTKSIMISRTPETPCPGLSPGTLRHSQFGTATMKRRISRTPVRWRHGLLSHDWAFNFSLLICFLLEFIQVFIQVIFNFIVHSYIYSFEFSLGFNALHLHLR
jgi:hypothetical protein